MKKLYEKIPKAVIIVSVVVAVILGVLFIKLNSAEARAIQSSTEIVSEIGMDVAALYSDDSKEMLADDATMEKVVDLEARITDVSDHLMDEETTDALHLASEDLDYAKRMIDLRDSAAALMDANGVLMAGADIASVEQKAIELQADKPAFVESQMVIINEAKAQEEKIATAEVVNEISTDVAALYADDSKEMLAEDATMDKIVDLEARITDVSVHVMDEKTKDAVNLASEDLGYAKRMVDLRDSAAALMDADDVLVAGADITSVEQKATELQPDKPVFVESQMIIINEAKAQEEQIATATAAVTALFTDETKTTVRKDVTREELDNANEQVMLIKQEQAKQDLTATLTTVDDYLTQKENGGENESESEGSSSSSSSGENESEPEDSSSSSNSGENESEPEDSSSNSSSEDYSMLVLVNTKNMLPSSYIPPDLVTPDVYLACSPGSDKSKLRKESADALERMFADAEEQGLQLSMVSGYRSYDRQAELFANEVAECGGDEDEAAKTVARPGSSEHQTGLAVDISSPNFDNQLEEEFGNTPEGIWLQENAHKYGFILRYPEACTDHTGIYYEPWHYRYVGVGPATEIYNQGICLEEYLQ